MTTQSDSMTAELRRSGGGLIDAFDRAVRGPVRTPAPGHWDADQIVGHVSLVNSATLATGYAVTASERPHYDNRLEQDPWTIAQALAAAGGRAGTVERIRHQVGVLAALAESLDASRDLEVLVPSVPVSGTRVLVDDLVPLADIIAGLSRVEWPNHAAQALELLDV